MGMLCGTIVMPLASQTSRHRLVVWAFRLLALALVILAFVLTTKNFCECGM